VKRDRAWVDVLDEVHGLTVTFPDPLPEHARKLMVALGVKVELAPIVRRKTP